jgi:hypothetical protein
MNQPPCLSFCPPKNIRIILLIMLGFLLAAVARASGHWETVYVSGYTEAYWEEYEEAVYNADTDTWETFWRGYWVEVWVDGYWLEIWVDDDPPLVTP